MRLLPDPSGRFPQRPYWPKTELESVIQDGVATFWRSRGQVFMPPWSTDDLTVFLETLTEDVDLYADLAEHGNDVEGMTTFSTGRKPRAAIAATLAADVRRENRLRTTLTHEASHALLHAPIWELAWFTRSEPLFGDRVAQETTGVCRRESVLHASDTDWLEWQAGYGSGAILMPYTLLEAVVRETARGRNLQVPAATVERDLISTVIDRFGVSEDAARVRLRVTNLCATSELEAPLLWN